MFTSLIKVETIPFLSEPASKTLISRNYRDGEKLPAGNLQNRD